ncbi:MAG: hypothetical protein WC791_00210 [Candidatus Paceibacterota bacterium]|jgi:hypothetical protein
MEEFFKAIENIATPEKPIEFIYIDHNEVGDREPVFKCKALTIDEADKMFEAEMGFHPKNNPNIGCVTEATVNEDWREKQNE